MINQQKERKSDSPLRRSIIIRYPDNAPHEREIRIYGHKFQWAFANLNHEQQIYVKPTETEQQ